MGIHGKPIRGRDDLLRLLVGNFEHRVAVRRASPRCDSEYCEWIICVGCGFDCMHNPDLAPVIGPRGADFAGGTFRKSAVLSCDSRAPGPLPHE